MLGPHPDPLPGGEGAYFKHHQRLAGLQGVIEFVGGKMANELAFEPGPIFHPGHVFTKGHAVHFLIRQRITLAGGPVQHRSIESPGGTNIIACIFALVGFPIPPGRADHQVYAKFTSELDDTLMVVGTAGQSLFRIVDVLQ
ncbi:MAG: hypothetical protein HC898_00810 [Phycisphaerales bacterium]|nr:hypothetical protein [Phycisphaerales bacterium]